MRESRASLMHWLCDERNCAFRIGTCTILAPFRPRGYDPLRSVPSGDPRPPSAAAPPLPDGSRRGTSSEEVAMRGARAVGSLACVVIVLSAVAATPAWAGPSPQVRRPAAAAAAAALPAPVPCNTSAGSCWRPPVVSRWQYQLQGSVNSAGQCIYPATGFINTAVTGAVIRDRTAGSAVGLRHRHLPGRQVLHAE